MRRHTRHSSQRSCVGLVLITSVARTASHQAGTARRPELRAAGDDRRLRRCDQRRTGGAGDQEGRASPRSSTCAKPPSPTPTSNRKAALAKAAGLRYFHVPFNGASPDPKAADAFIAAITSPGAEPAFIHCSGGNRAATMWMIKRMVVDHWDAERATKEAMALGQTSAPLRQFAIDYARQPPTLTRRELESPASEVRDAAGASVTLAPHAVLNSGPGVSSSRSRSSRRSQTRPAGLRQPTSTPASDRRTRT